MKNAIFKQHKSEHYRWLSVSNFDAVGKEVFDKIGLSEFQEDGECKEYKTENEIVTICLFGFSCSVKVVYAMTEPSTQGLEHSLSFDIIGPSEEKPDFYVYQEDGFDELHIDRYDYVIENHSE